MKMSGTEIKNGVAILESHTNLHGVILNVLSRETEPKTATARQRICQGAKTPASSLSKLHTSQWKHCLNVVTVMPSTRQSHPGKRQ
jgi:hypothetical protein